MPSIYADLPQIIRFDGVEDAGEYGAALCPHCGAQGRYVWHFSCADGTNRGAMAGCLKHFAVHPLAREQQRLLNKEREYSRKGWTLTRADARILEAIDAWQHAELSEEEAFACVRGVKAGVAAWRKSRGSRRY